MACGITDLTGCVGDVVGSAVSSVWDNICQSFGDAATSMLQGFGNAFASTDTVDLSSDGVRSVYALSLGIAAVVAALLLLWQVVRTVWTHEGTALAQGLVGVAKAAMAFLMTLTVTTAGVAAADDISHFIVNEGFGTDAALGQKLGTLFAADAIGSPTLLMLMALIGIIITAILWFELLMRGAAIAIFVATSPIAAAGQVNDSTRSWWSRLVSATIQLIILKPVIALVFMLGFKISSQSSGIQQTLTGLLILLMAVFAWPSVARFFAFASVAVGGTAGLGGLLGFAAGRSTAMAGASSTGGGSTTGFSQAAEARTTAAKSALGLGPGSRGSGDAAVWGASASTAKQSTITGAMAKASTAFAGAGPLGAAAAGARAAQGAINLVSGRMEQMAGHAGLAHASPYHQAAGAAPHQNQGQLRRGSSDTRPTMQTIPEQHSAPGSSRSGAAQAERVEPPERPPANAARESERVPDRGEPAAQPEEYPGSAHYEAPAESSSTSVEVPNRSAESSAGPAVSAPPPSVPPVPHQPSPQQLQETLHLGPEPMSSDVPQENKEKDR